MPIRALIVDDEAPARDELAFLLQAHPDVEAAQAASAEEALRRIALERVGLVFQDIQMPAQDGLHVLAGAQQFPHTPHFGLSNQLLASSGLIIGTTMLIRLNKAMYAWLTAVPGIIMAACITMYAGYLQATGVDLKPGKENDLLATMACIIMSLMVVVFIGAFRRWSELLSIQTTQPDEYRETVVALADE